MTRNVGMKETNMKYAFYMVMLLSLCGCRSNIGLPCGQTIDEYVKASNKEMLWGNCVSGIMKPVNDIKDTKSIFENAFEHLSYDEGRPAFKDCRIVESKYGMIHGQKYYLIRYLWKNKQRMLLIDTTPLTGDFEGFWSVR